MHRARAYLPDGPKTVTTLPQDNDLVLSSLPTMAAAVAHAWPEEQLHRLLPLVAAHGPRLIANSITLLAWRNGPIEDVHAGFCGGYGMQERRLLPQDEQAVLHQALSYFHAGLKAAFFLREGSGWPPPAHRVLPFLRPLIHPSRWSHDEVSRVVQLPLRNRTVASPPR